MKVSETYSADSKIEQSERHLIGDRPAMVLLVPAGLMLFLIAAPIVCMLLKIDGEFVRVWMWDAQILKAIGLSLIASACATVIAIVLGVPLAYLCARYDFPGRSLIEGIITLPILIPHVAAGVALLVTFGGDSLLGRAMRATGLELIDSFAGIVAAILFVSFPFLFAAVRDGFVTTGRREETMARVLGATPWQGFWTIAVPQVRRHIVSGAVMMWARGISEFGAVVIIAYHPMVASVLLYRRFDVHGLAYARPVAIMLILMSLLVLVPVLILNRRRRA